MVLKNNYSYNLKKSISKKHNKEHIPIISLKLKLWKANRHPSDKYIAECQTCDATIKAPLSLVPHLAQDDHELQRYFSNTYNILSTAEFGHKISEKNGGKISCDNFILQCKRCNLTYGSKNIPSNHIGQQDSLMLKDEYYNENITQFMDIESEYCLALTKQGHQCKNKPSFSHGVCSVHCGY